MNATNEQDKTPGAKSGTHIPAGCDSETSERIETVAGPVNVRIRRWPWDGGAWTRHEVLIETPLSRKDGTGYKSLGAVEDLTDKPVGDLLTAHIVASRFVQDSAMRSPRRRVHAPDRTAEPPNNLPPSPGTGETVEDGARPVRPLPPAKEGKAGLYAFYHARGKQMETHLGKTWDVERPARIKALLGYPKSSTGLSYDALSVLVDDMTADLEAGAVDVAKLDAEYAARRQAGTSQAQTRQAAIRPSGSTAPRGARSRRAEVAGE